MISLDAQVVDERLFYAAKRVQPVTDAEPQHARRSTLRKHSEALECHVERRDADGLGEHAADSLLERVVDVAEKMQRQVHPLGVDP